MYFSCLEALQNVAKYAEAIEIVITLADFGDRLSFTVADDGRGFDTSGRGYGTGPSGDRRPPGRARRASHGHVVTGTRDHARGIAPRGRAGGGVRVSGTKRATKKPKGLRRVERWMVGLAMGVMAFILEKAVMRSVKKGGGSTPAPEPTTITSKGAEADLD